MGADRDDVAEKGNGDGETKLGRRRNMDEN